MSRINLLKVILLVQTIGLIIYTIVAYKAEGAGLFGIAIDNIASMKWSGQFNLDFFCYLTLSGIWIMWRDKFSGKSVLLGIVAMVLGIVFFAPYVLWLLTKEKGDMKRVLIGDR